MNIDATSARVAGQTGVGWGWERGGRVGGVVPHPHAHIF